MSYRDINRGPQLKKAYDEYHTWLDKTPQQRSTLYANSRKGDRFTYSKQTIYIAPFGQPAKIMFVEAKGPVNASASPAGELLSFLGGTTPYFVNSKPAATGTTVLEPTVFPINKLAKLVLVKRVSTATEQTASRITGRTYKHHTVNSASMPFGKKDANDSFGAAVTAIKVAAKSFNDVVGNSVRFIPEG